MDFDNASMEVLMAAEVMAVTVVIRRVGRKRIPICAGGGGGAVEATVPRSGCGGDDVGGEFRGT